MIENPNKELLQGFLDLLAIGISLWFKILQAIYLFISIDQSVKCQFDKIVVHWCINFCYSFILKMRIRRMIHVFGRWYQGQLT